MLARLIADPRFEGAILALILVNAVTLGLETSEAVTARFGTVLHVVDVAILTVFVLELIARILVQRLAFFRDPWGLFDLFVVSVALLPATGSLSVLRVLRVLRILRLVTALPSLRRVVAGLVTALPGMGSISLLLIIIFYVFSVMATELFGRTSPEQFGSLGSSAYTLFQVMTFDDWSNGVLKPLLPEHPYATPFFLLFILFSTFMALNLFIGVIVSAIDEETAKDVPKLTHPARDEAILAEIRALRGEVAALREERAGR